MPPEFCPHCGAEVPPHAKACPQCGSDEHTGWSEQARYDALDLPESEFDHAEFVAREFGKPSPVPWGVHWSWWLVAAALAAGLLAAWLS